MIKLDMFDIGEYFPFPTEEERLTRYKENKNLFMGKHYEVFVNNTNLTPAQQKSIYISINLPALICKKSADFLFGEPAQVMSGKEDDSNEQKALERLHATNEMNIALYESALSNAYRGDAFFRIRHGQEYNGILDKEADPFKVFIEPVAAEYVFPITEDGNKKKIIGYHVAVPTAIENLGEYGKWRLDVETHVAGEIMYHAYMISPIMMNADGTVYQWKITHKIESEMKHVKTNIPLPLITHVPNFATDDEWQGIDDLTELKPLFDELNRRLTEISDILTKHSDPAIAVPTGVMGEDEHGNATFRVAHDKVFEVMGKDDVVPQYITWQSNLNEAFTELEKITDYILMIAEIPAVALGKGDSGTSGASGLSIKWRLNSLLAKVNRKKQYYNKALKRIYLIAQLVEKEMNLADYEIVMPVMKFGDGLPTDAMEQATIMQIRTGNKPTVSQKTALMIMDDLTEEQAEQEISRIDDEQKKMMEQQQEFAEPSVFNNEPMPKPQLPTE